MCVKPLKPDELLDIWEQGLNQPLLHRSLLLLTAASPESSADAIANLSIGARDARLMQLREWLFGSRLSNTSRCPRCSERVEWENEIGQLRIPASPPCPAAADFSLAVDEYNVRFRLPTSADVIEIVEKIYPGEDRPGDVRSPGETPTVATSPALELLQRCIHSAEHAGKPCALAQLPETVYQALSQRIEEIDPQADIRIQLACPQCTHRWAVWFDIASFLWAEIDAWAERTLQVVHTLASAYGWSERDILNLSPVRRQLYLGLVTP